MNKAKSMRRMRAGGRACRHGKQGDAWEAGRAGLGCGAKAVQGGKIQWERASREVPRIHRCFTIVREGERKIGRWRGGTALPREFASGARGLDGMRREETLCSTNQNWIHVRKSPKSSSSRKEYYTWEQ